MLRQCCQCIPHTQLGGYTLDFPSTNTLIHTEVCKCIGTSHVHNGLICWGYSRKTIVFFIIIRTRLHTLGSTPKKAPSIKCIKNDQ